MFLKFKIKSQSGFALSSSRGFTLVELLVVMALVATMAGLGLFLSADMYRDISFRSDINSIIASAQKARSQSINNIDEKPHGIRLDTSDYTIFEGSSYATRDTSKDQTLPANPSFTFSGPTEIVFTQLSGESNATGNLVIYNGFKTATISLNYEGQIDY